MTSQRGSDVRRAIQALHEMWVDAVTRGDCDALGECLTEDYVAWPAGAAPIVGREAAVQAMAPMFAVATIQQTFESHDLVVGTDWALDRGIESFVITPLDGSPPQEHRQRAVILLRRDDDGRWRYAWGMTSPGPDRRVELPDR